MKTFILREPRHMEALMAFLAGNWLAMSRTKHPLVVECKPESTKRSTLQNKYYWAVLHQIEEQAWIEGRQYSSEVWHEAAKRRFIGLVDLPGGGTMAQSTTTLSTKEFLDYVTKVEAWAQQELGVSLMDMTERIGRCA